MRAGNVLASVSFLELKPGEELPVSVTLRDLPESAFTGLKISLEPSVKFFSGETKTLSSLSSKGLVLVWIEPGKEPTRHLLNDLPGLKEEFDRWGGWFVFLTDPDRMPEGFTPESVGGTPENTLFATDPGLELLRSLHGSGLRHRPMPVVICCNSAGEVIFSSEGYRIGTGQQLLKEIKE